jgi:hypothetical protein|tara:strand:+ start:847 stop:1311 length:465 start_codon:yes stop_codon:yes gene_type:complete
MTDAIAKLKELGLSIQKPTMEVGQLPSDITMLSSEQIGEKFTVLTAWADYASTQMAIAVIEERSSQRRLDFLQNKLLLQKMGTAIKGERITLVKAQIAVDQDIQDLTLEYEEKYAYRKLVEMMLNNFERDISLVSREVTRRSNDLRSTRKEWGV